MSVRASDGPTQHGDVFRLLNARGVDFVVIGGLAALAQGASYPTYDLDVAYERSNANLERLAQVLIELEVTLRGAPPDLPFQIDARSLENGANFTFETKFGAVDFLSDLRGAPRYEELRRQAVLTEIEGSEVRIASVDHLIAMKRAANRPKDRLMLEELLVIADEERR